MKTPPAVLYLEDVLGQLSHYCTEVDVTWEGKVRPPKECKCVACVLAAGLDEMLTAEWEARCKAERQNTSVPSAADAGAAGLSE